MKFRSLLQVVQQHTDMIISARSLITNYGPCHSDKVQNFLLPTSREKAIQLPLEKYISTSKISKSKDTLNENADLEELENNDNLMEDEEQENIGEEASTRNRHTPKSRPSTSLQYSKDLDDDKADRENNEDKVMDLGNIENLLE